VQRHLVVGYGLRIVLKLVVFLGDVGVDAPRHPAVGQRLLVEADGALVLLLRAVGHAERVGHVGIVRLLPPQLLQQVHGRLHLLSRYHLVGAPDTHLRAVGVEVFGIADSLLERLLVVHLEVVVDDDLQLVHVEELALAFHHGALEIQHEVAHLLVEIFESIFHLVISGQWLVFSG